MNSAPKITDRINNLIAGSTPAVIAKPLPKSKPTIVAGPTPKSMAVGRSAGTDATEKAMNSAYKVTYGSQK